MINMEASLEEIIDELLEHYYIFRFGKSEIKMFQTSSSHTKHTFQVEAIAIDTEELVQLFMSRKKE